MMPEPSSCSKGERILREILHEAAHLFIPRGRIRDFIPDLPQEAKPLIATRDRLREASPTHPDISALNSEITAELESSRRDTWEREMTSAESQRPKLQILDPPRQTDGEED